MTLTSEWFLTLINIGATFLVGFLLSIYLFFYRLRVNEIWRWLGGIFCGFVTGSLMALLALMIVWP